jgi:hypothetical protein
MGKSFINLNKSYANKKQSKNSAFFAIEIDVLSPAFRRLIAAKNGLGSKTSIRKFFSLSG